MLGVHAANFREHHAETEAVDAFRLGILVLADEPRTTASRFQFDSDTKMVAAA